MYGRPSLAFVPARVTVVTDDERWAHPGDHRQRRLLRRGMPHLAPLRSIDGVVEPANQHRTRTASGDSDLKICKGDTCRNKRIVQMSDEPAASREPLPVEAKSGEMIRTAR